MTDVVFDRDILVDALRGHPSAQGEITRATRRFVSRLTWIELMTEALPEDTARIEGFLACFGVIELGEDIARRAAMLRGDPYHAGLTLAEAVVLASAQATGRILVTRNTRAFPANMPGIRVPYSA